MQDVPEIDYDSEIQKIGREHALAQVPKDIAAMYKDDRLAPYMRRANATVYINTLLKGEDWKVVSYEEYADAKAAWEKSESYDPSKSWGMIRRGATSRPITSASMRCQGTRALLRSTHFLTR